MSKGSTWNIWDLHLHTPFSALNNQFGDPLSDETWEKYVGAIESAAKEKGVVALGLADYFTIDGYKRVLELQKAGWLKDILLMPNIEFRIDKVVYRGKETGDPKRLNLHVIFSPEVPIQEIEEGFLHELDFVYENEPFDAAKTRKLKPSNLTDFGKMLKAQHAEFTGSEFEIGCKTAIVQTEQVKKCLDNRFRGRHLLMLAEENLSLLEWGSQHHAIRLQLVQMAHAILSANENTREFCLGRRHATLDEYLSEFKSLKPCVWGCDSHGYKERFLEPDQSRYTWIKAEISWEGLKQILYEPEERVRIQKDCPEPPKSIFTLQTLGIGKTQVNDTLSIKAFETEMNSNLVAIIGGRGSGKTALLDLVASCFKEGNKLAALENSFYSRLYKQTNQIDEVNKSPIPVILTFNSGETIEKNIGEDSNNFEKSDILYLTQNHFDEYSSNPNKLNHYIIDLVFERFPDEKRKYREMEQDVVELEQKIQTINLEIEHLSAELEGQREIEEISLKQKKGEREDYVQRLEIIQKRQGVSNEEILNLTKGLNDFKTQKRDIESLFYQLSMLTTEITSFEVSFHDKVSEINTSLNSLSGDTKPPNIPEEVAGLQKIIQSTDRTSKALNQRLVKIDSSIEAVEGQIDALEGLSRELAGLQQQADEVSSEIRDIERRVKEIGLKEKKVEQFDEERFQKYSMIIEKTREMRVFLQSIIAHFEVGKDEVLNHLGFTAIIDIGKYREFLETLMEKIDNRVHPINQIDDAYSAILKNLETLLNENDPVMDYSEILGQIKSTSSRLKLKKSVTISDFYNVVLYKYFGIGLRIRFSDKDLSELSMGERAVVLLKILLALDDTPLLIDQPEEHLDNTYIYKELVPAFRQAKAKRQIIIATHNANLVVNTDAEQIIIARYVNGSLSYEVGTLEDLGIRENIKTILEGGDEAFKRREAKYGYIF